MVSTPLIVPIALRPGAVLGGLMVCSRKPQPTSIVPIAPRGHAVHDALRHLFSGNLRMDICYYRTSFGAFRQVTPLATVTGNSG